MPYSYQSILNMRVEVKKCKVKLQDPSLSKMEKLWYEERIFILEGKMGEDKETTWGKTTRELKRQFQESQAEAIKQAQEAIEELERLTSVEDIDKAVEEMEEGDSLPNGSGNSESKTL